MGKASRRKHQLKTPRNHDDPLSGSPPAGVTDPGADPLALTLKRLAAQDQADARHSPSPEGFPVDYIERLRAANHPVFRYLEVDLQRMLASGETPEQIFPPNGECNETRYAEDALRVAMSRIQSNPWLRSPGAVEAAYGSSVTEYRSLLSFLHAGSKTYFFGDAIAESLSYTALNMPAPALRLPVPAFEFVFHSEVACEAYHACTGTPMRAVSTLSVFVREDTLKEIGCRRLIIAAYEHGDTMAAASGVLIRRLAMREDWDLEAALNTDWDKIDRPAEGKNWTTARHVGWTMAPDGSVDVSEGLPEPFLNEKSRFVRMILNGILYITSRGADITEKLATHPVHKGGHRPGGAGTPARRTYIEVGESVKRMPVIIDPTIRYDALPPHITRRSLKVRFLVPGFYRRPPNSAPDAAKSVWVSPHYKGPEMADLVNNPYVVR